ncbi:monovalent cation/H+ antiporter subunit A [Sphingosinicella rhizophila]|uniref:Monovalent cation/H+ antiporter subunit A n=1 Tax=Sphingosinicella rhizophila TaxID=3050082 RepID=A0ABU3QCC7_9SPHN|nr:monovalent cation/H+ antiporter subunit A [Sphingosinicella sp. GR2756]MDT9601056.1 monovalent cation/H+ antiporter subunit A [Sphingosinicella sp. GR2756]
MSDDGVLWLMLALPFAGSLTAAFLPVRARNAAGVLAGAVALAGTFLTAILYSRISGGEVIRAEIEWLPSLGLNLLLRLDGLSWIFAFLVLAVGFLVVLYARYYMSPEDPVPRFFSFLLAFMGSMLGLVVAGNLVQLAFFWELTSLFSFLLIGYWHHNQSARDAARMALIVTAAGGLCLLIGLLLIGKIVGSYDLDVALASGDLVRSSELYVPALILILIGAFTKSAQFPFHFWLPHAMAAPTPVSAYLHSATMVKAGVFVLILLWPVLAGTDIWYLIVSTTGLATLLFGAWAAMFQQDLKGLLAYSTISHLGLITLLLGLGSPLAAVAAIFHTLNHATFKASLFMAAGIVDHETGTRDLRKLSGLSKFMPITATLAMVAAAAMAGVPLLNGFLSKEMFLAEALDQHRGTIIDQALPVLATLALAFSVLYSLRFIHQSFFGPPPVGLPREPREPPGWMRLPIEILVLACLIVGIVPALTIGPFLDTAVRSVLHERTPQYSLAIWHGFTAPLLLSFIALASGTAGYLMFRERLNRRESAPLMRRLKGRKAFEAVLAAIMSVARALERLLGTRSLQSQLRLLALIALLAALLPFMRDGYSLGSHPGTIVDPGFAVIWIVGGACAVGAAWQAKYHRLAALILMAGAGLASCISFVWLSAPDLAITQLLVETVTTVLLLLGLRWLPRRLKEVWPENRTPWQVKLRRGSDLAIAVAAGAGMTLLAYAIMSRTPPDSISREFVARSYPEGGGTNVVNVILVDFRSFDTLGEISVLGIVALTVFSLLRRFRPAAESVATPDQQLVQDAHDDARKDRRIGDTLADYLLVPRVLMQWLFPVILVLALYLFIRGHDMPGGGFAAGITLSVGLILQYMALGTRRAEDRLRMRPIRWIGLGFLVALATGAGAWLFDHPFLTSWFRYLELPIFGSVPLASALLFDLGVFLVVVGATALILIALAHQSIRTPRAGGIAPLDPAQSRID